MIGDNCKAENDALMLSSTLLLEDGKVLAEGVPDLMLPLKPAKMLSLEESVAVVLGTELVLSVIEIDGGAVRDSFVLELSLVEQEVEVVAVLLTVLLELVLSLRVAEDDGETEVVSLSIGLMLRLTLLLSLREDEELVEYVMDLVVLVLSLVETLKGSEGVMLGECEMVALGLKLPL